MPSVRYYNATAPFWDFVASMEQTGVNRNGAGENDERPDPWTNGWTGFPMGPFPHRGRRPGPPHHHQHQGPAPPEGDNSDPEAGPSHPRGEESGEEGREHRSGSPHRGHGHGPRSFGGRGGHCGRGRGGAWGGHGRAHHFQPYPVPGPFGAWAQMFQDQLFSPAGCNEDGKKAKNSDDFVPEADIFDTPEAFVVHVSLPGAKKEDVGVNWDAEKSELSVAGVVYRPGDEEFLKTLALDERKVGAFERKVRLGSRANPAQVDVDAITARMEDGVLTVEVPKLDSGYVEIKKVDIE